MIKAVIVHAAEEKGIPGEDYLSSMPQFKLLAKAYSVEDGIKMIQIHQPNLVMLDLEMQEEESWRVFEATKGLTYEKIVFSKSALSAFRLIRFEVGAQLVKPLQPEELRESIAKILFDREEYGIQRMYNQRIRKQLSLDRVFLPHGHGTHLVKITEISWVEGTQMGCMVVLRNGRILLTNYSIQKMGKLLAHGPFFRICSEILIQLHSEIRLEKEGDAFFVHSDLGFCYNLPYQRVATLKEKLSRIGE